MIAYNKIKNELDSLSRPDAYAKLLLTKEWFSFRERIVESDNRTCVQCCRVEGIIKIPIQEDKYKRKVEEVRIHNIEFQKKIKDPTYKERYIKILSGEIDEPIDGLLGNPCDHEYGGEVIIQVHHKLYFYDKLPWEYERKNVETLCSDCHKEIHATTNIITYKDESMTWYFDNKPCPRCFGTGYLDHYNYVQNGICFQCGGYGSINSTENRVDSKII